MSSDNLVLFHLESISEAGWQKHSRDLEFLSRLRRQSYDFHCFNTAATSSLMSLSSLLCGSCGGLDGLTAYEENHPVPQWDYNLLAKLKADGYTLGFVGFPERNNSEKLDCWNVLPRKEFEIFSWYRTHEHFLTAIETFVAGHKDRKFCLYIWDLASNCSFGSRCSPELTFAERVGSGVKNIDLAAQTLHRALASGGVAEKTVTAYFGDHGDDSHTKSFSAGLVHSVEPYDFMIRTPFFLHCQGREGAVSEALVSSCDAKAIILSMLDGSAPAVPRREAVFAQNLFVNQRPSVLLNKAYAAADADHLLIVSPLGLEMYDRRLDPANQNNLLSFFDLAAGRLTMKKIFHGVHQHFRNQWRDNDIVLLNERFRFLFFQLRDWVSARELMVGAQGDRCLAKKVWGTIRSREYLWRFLSHSREPLMMVIEQAYKLVLMEAWAEALKVLRQAAAMAGENPPAVYYRLLLNCWFGLGALREATALAVEAVRRHPGNAHLHCERILIARASNDRAGVPAAFAEAQTCLTETFPPDSLQPVMMAVIEAGMGLGDHDTVLSALLIWYRHDGTHVLDNLGGLMPDLPRERGFELLRRMIACRKSEKLKALVQMVAGQLRPEDAGFGDYLQGELRDWFDAPSV